jgi:hypothetical protein
VGKKEFVNEWGFRTMYSTTPKNIQLFTSFMIIRNVEIVLPSQHSLTPLKASIFGITLREGQLALAEAHSLHVAKVYEVCNCLQALKECKIVYKIKNCEVFTWFAWFQASTAVYMTPSLFWDVTLRRLVIVTNASGQNIGHIFKGLKTYWPLKITPIDCPEMSVTNYQSTHHNIREEWRSPLLDLFVYLEFI